MQHRGERRGLGGIFFDDLNDYDQEMLLAFATGNAHECGKEAFSCGFTVEFLCVSIGQKVTFFARFQNVPIV